MSKIKIGGRLKALREEKRISQRQVTRDTGIIQKTLSSYENDKNSPSLEALKILSEYYKVSVDYLIYGDRNNLGKENLKYDRLIKYIYSESKLDQKEISFIEMFLERVIYINENKEGFRSFVKDL